MPSENTSEENNNIMLGNVSANFMDNEPEDIDNFLSENGLNDIEYACTLRRYTMSEAESEYLPGEWENKYPKLSEIGKTFGPGKYIIRFMWKQPPAEGRGRPRNAHKDYKVTLGEEWREVYDEYMITKWVEREKKINNQGYLSKLKRAHMGKDPESGGEKEDSIETLKKSMGLLRDLGVPMGQGAASKPLMQGGEMVQFLGLIMQAQSESTKNNMQMMMQMNQQMMGMMTAVIQSQKPQSTNDLVKEFMNMVQSTVDIREALTPEKKGMVDKVFELMEAVMPQIVALANRPKSERVQDPLYKLATTSKEMQAMKNDETMLKAMIQKWDKAHGPEQTDIILESVNMKRPADMTIPESARRVLEEEDGEGSTETDNPTFNPLTDDPEGDEEEKEGDN